MGIRLLDYAVWKAYFLKEQKLFSYLLLFIWVIRSVYCTLLEIKTRIFTLIIIIQSTEIFYVNLTCKISIITISSVWAFRFFPLIRKIYVQVISKALPCSFSIWVKILFLFLLLSLWIDPYYVAYRFFFGFLQHVSKPWNIRMQFKLLLMY